MSRGVLTDLLRHSAWANIALIEFVRGLEPAQRAWTAPGTYGAVDKTLAHIVSADTYYLFRLTGERPSAGPPEKRPLIDLEDLMRRAREAAMRYERYASGPVDPDEIRRHEVRPTAGDAETREETVGTILAQAIHHGNEHRSHIGTILDAHGLSHPDYSGWAWGRSLPSP